MRAELATSGLHIVTIEGTHGKVPPHTRRVRWSIAQFTSVATSSVVCVYSVEHWLGEYVGMGIDGVSTATRGKVRTLSSAARRQAWSDSRWRAIDAASRPHN